MSYTYEPPIHDPRHDEDFEREKAKGDCSSASCSDCLDEDADEICIHCGGHGWVICRCGGDICFCVNHGEADCPECCGTGYCQNVLVEGSSIQKILTKPENK